MKRSISVLLSAILAASFLFASCGETQPEAGPGSGGSPAAPSTPSADVTAEDSGTDEEKRKQVHELFRDKFEMLEKQST